ncbi:GTP pyrophosphokinase family protein [uncultured Eubacterium sp.]|uniref:GTP pyrophosphokinase n=1 Tax=uncultured Eubacterium sp. TaxID=165185 RepID=UPI0025FA4592|nr:GTP pyrophosphokinase family protein [uncultured Eubacterium sp.]
MDEKVKVTDKEADTEKTVNKETDKNTNKDTTSKAKMMEADLTDHSEQQDEAGAEEAASYLPLAADQLDLAKQYKQMMLIYEAGIRQLTTKLQILNREFEQSNDRNPIENIKSRIKSAESIAKKMERKGLPMTLSCLTNNIYDIAGIRVICPFITDVYEVARMLLSQTDVELIQVKDYIREPKKNGYRSLHLIVKINVFFSDGMRQVPVEVQLRTIAMNFWASTEHQIRYKKDKVITPEMHARLKKCADIMADADYQMQKLAEEIHF